jgi:hypothetical protein
MRLIAIATIQGAKDIDGGEPVKPGRPFEIEDAEGEVLVNRGFARPDHGNTDDKQSKASREAQKLADQAAANVNAQVQANTAAHAQHDASQAAAAQTAVANASPDPGPGNVDLTPPATSPATPAPAVDPASTVQPAGKTTTKTSRRS